MKTLKILSLFLIFLIAVSCSNQQASTEKDPLIVEIPESLSIEEKLKMLPFVEMNAVLPDSFRFEGSYKLMVTQPIDHNNPDAGTFTQKVFVNFKDCNKPVVVYLDGYSVPTNAHICELSDMLDANFVQIEHRFFGESTPDSLMWNFLNIKQAAADHHRVIKLLKNIFKNKWISTGISKGGQTAMYHKRFYPEDVDVTVAYVAPLNLEVQDKRIYNFLNNVGTPECRKKILDFQRFLLNNREEALKEFNIYSRKTNNEYTCEIEKAFELSILEFEFAFWQWGGNCENLPDNYNSVEEHIQYLFRADGPGFFSKATHNDLFPFFYQAYTEQGLYGYRTDSLKGLLKFFDGEVNNYQTFIPETFNLTFNNEAMKDIKTWLDENGNNMVYIYGEYDSWSSTAYEPTKKTNSFVVYKKGGSHLTRLQNMPKETQDSVISIIKTWLKE
ncbi:MAG: hypothetical protein JXR58_00305 [Bacteroidales bacterium]|nr:hypothetical protein [Bacteroidales bacterium]